MSLLDMWKRDPEQLAKKLLHQIIGFAGDGRLSDKTATSSELREYLAHVPSKALEIYAQECLEAPFKDSGLALQDVVNEIGHRIGFVVDRGRYRGVRNTPGHDGLWASPEGHRIIVEVKTTDAYRISLESIAKYRRTLVRDASINEATSSILIIVGRDDTGDLEAQIRGSKHAWDIRLISVGALTQLLKVKESIQTPETERRVRAILLPREFTRLDAIIDLVFNTAGEAKDEEDLAPSSEERDTIFAVDGPASRRTQNSPTNFYDECIPRLERHFGCTLVKRSRITFVSPDGSLGITCAISRAYVNARGRDFWFAFHPHQREFLESTPRGFAIFGCGSADDLFVVPIQDLILMLPGMNATTLEDGRTYSHIQIYEEGVSWTMRRKRGESPIDIGPYKLLSP